MLHFVKIWFFSVLKVKFVKSLLSQVQNVSKCFFFSDLKVSISQNFGFESVLNV